MISEIIRCVSIGVGAFAIMQLIRAWREYDKDTRNRR